MSSNSETAQVELTPVAFAPVDIRSAQVLGALLASLWRRKLLVVAIIGASLVLGIAVVFVTPPRYTAVAYLRGIIADLAAVTKATGSGSAGFSLDALRVIETQTRQLQSFEVARRVVAQLGVESLSSAPSESPSLLSRIFGYPKKTSGTADDLAAKALMRDLSVISDPKAYLMAVTYTDTNPKVAASVANAFVAEFLRSTKLQALSQQRELAETTLSTQLTTFGDKHPRVAETKLRLADIDKRLKDQLTEAPEALLKAAGENVTTAVAAPSGPHAAFIIGLFFFLGLLISVALAIWLERSRWRDAFSRYYAKPFA